MSHVQFRKPPDFLHYTITYTDPITAYIDRCDYDRFTGAPETMRYLNHSTSFSIKYFPAAYARYM